MTGAEQRRRRGVEETEAGAMLSVLGESGNARSSAECGHASMQLSAFAFAFCRPTVSYTLTLWPCPWRMSVPGDDCLHATCVQHCVAMHL